MSTRGFKLGARIGAVVQGVILGGLLTFALVRLIELESGAQVFRYQGF